MSNLDSYRKTRIAEIDAELRRLREKRKRLLAEKTRLREHEHIPNSRFWATPVLAAIKLQPGSSREDVRKFLNEFMTDRISEPELTNALTTLRRRGLIQNLGTKKRSNWHLHVSRENHAM